VLFLKENGRHGFEFPPRGAAARAEGEAGAAAGEAKTPRRRAPREKPAKVAAEGKPARKAARAPRTRARRKRPASGDSRS
jgi:hypothetical protein